MAECMAFWMYIFDMYRSIDDKHAYMYVLEYVRTYTHVCTSPYFHTCYMYNVQWSHHMLPGNSVTSFGAHCTCQLFLSYIWWALNVIAGSLHVVEQSSISVTDTARNGLWIFIHTCSGPSVIAPTFTH